jgi:hypothetical protein
VVTTLAGLAGSSGDTDGAGNHARFNVPIGLTVDSSANVYVADMFNNAIRKITPDGTVSTLAGRLSYNTGSADGAGHAAWFCHPCGLVADNSGNIYVTDSDNHTIRRITPDGTVTTLAGFPEQFGNSDGTGNAARFWHPVSIALDGNGNILVADLDNAAIRKGCPASLTNASLTLKTDKTMAHIP